MSETEITLKSIIAGLKELGLESGDTIIMHSNLGSLGRARVLSKLPNCGCDHIINAFLEVIGSDGILCLPTFTNCFLGPGGPSGLVYNPDTTPSRVGSITNIVRERPESVRSLHPTHPWSAIGSRAEEFVAGHDQTSTFGRDSICGRMYDWDSKIVWFGTDGRTNTSTHFAEDWLNLPYMTSEDALVKDGDGFKKVTVTRSPSGPRDFYSENSKTDKKLAEWDIQKSVKIHAATVTVMRHRDFMNNLLRTMIDDPCLLLKDGRDDAYHTRFTQLHGEYMEQLKSRKGGTEGILKDLDCLKE